MIRFITALFLFCSIVSLFSQTTEENIISYYAVSNSLDGQPMIEQMNKLRFFPVFAMHENITTVTVTIYYGPNIYTRDAVSHNNKKYWEMLLPSFKLGEAIQRIEVEVDFELDNAYHLRFKDEANSVQLKLDKNMNPIYSAIASIDTNQILTKAVNSAIKFQEGFTNLNLLIKESDLELPNNTLTNLSKLNNYLIPLQQKTADTSFIKNLNILAKTLNRLSKISDDSAMVNSLKTLNDTLVSIIRNHKIIECFNNITQIDSIFEFVKSEISKLDSKSLKDILEKQTELNNKWNTFQNDELDSIITNLNSMKVIYNHLSNLRTKVEIIDSLVVLNVRNKDKLKSDIENSIEIGLADSSYSGQSVRKSDIIINADFSRARILYRNYKGSLRHMPALDPAEKLGIFRVRFIPFPIAKLPDSTHMQLIPMSGAGASIVFEIGLAFGNAIVPGDDFVVPAFSWNRLGFAFAITEKLFAPDAQLIGLALTYDFNSYASIGIGGNFAGRKIGGYASLGINKKAFEQVVGAIGGLFK